MLRRDLDIFFFGTAISQHFLCRPGDGPEHVLSEIPTADKPIAADYGPFFNPANAANGLTLASLAEPPMPSISYLTPGALG